MVCYHSSIPVDEHLVMAKSVNSADPCLKLKQINQVRKTKKIPNHLNIPACEQSCYAVIDVIISIVVIGACGYLLYPYASFIARKSIELGAEVVDVMGEEIARAPMIFTCLGLSVLCAGMALVAIAVFMERRCGKPGCRGLRKAAEFDIQLETEESARKSTYVAKNGLKKGLFELPRDYHRELEAELKKMAPPNGRAVLVFKARCGCSVGRMEVPGPKKSVRKVKN